MRGRCLKTHVIALGVLAAFGCTPEGEPPALNRAATMQGENAVSGGSGAGSYLAGRQAQKTRDYPNASRYLERALEDSPDNSLLLRRTFLAKLAEGEIGSAVPLAHKVIAQEKSAPIAKLVLVVEGIKTDRLDDAEKILATFPNRGFSGFMKPLLESWILVGQGRGEKAVAALDPLKKEAGLRVLYELHAALLSDAAGRSDEAARHYRFAGESARRSTLRVVQGLGRHLERNGQPEKAKTLYEAYIGQNPDSVVLGPAIARIADGEVPPLLAANAKEGVAEALFNIASTMTRQNSAQLALIYGRLSTYLRPDFDLAYMLVAGVLESMNRYEEAIATYNKVRPASPLNWSARLRIAGNLEALERQEDAIRLLQDLTDEDSTRPGPLVSLGDLLRSNKRFDESVVAYSRAVGLIGKLDRRHWTILYSRGIALERSRQWALAERDFQRALELNPDQPYVLNYLGYSWVDQGINLDRAREMIERAVKLRPNDGYIVDSLGWVLYRLSDFEGAVTHLERAVELRSQDPTINDHLGDAYWRVGRYAEARFQWRRALTLKPEPDQVSLIEEKLRHGLGKITAEGKDS